MKSLIVLSLLNAVIFSLPIDVKLNNENTGDAQFNVLLPSNETIQISLSVRLMKHVPSPEYSTSAPALSTTVLAGDSSHIDKADSVPQFVTVDEAIEIFRQDLISKEKNIGGIIYSDHIFYRHFKLEFGVGEEITIRCSYNSERIKKTLKIDCLEYRDAVTERLLSNGEVEELKIADTTYKSEYILLDLRSLKQTFNMNIS